MSNTVIINSNKLANLIKNSGKTATEIAETLGYTKRSLSSILKRGKASTPYVIALAKYLGVNVEYFIKRSDTQESSKQMTFDDFHISNSEDFKKAVHEEVYNALDDLIIKLDIRLSSKEKTSIKSERAVYEDGTILEKVEE